MSQIVLGKAGGRNVAIDLELLLRTRLLVQANSGGGKSWLLRRLAEQLFGKVPVFLIDREGEFSTLREKFGYVLVGQGGDTAADVRSARLLAEKLLELRASAVFDLYEAFRSRPLDRRAWVRAFLDGLLDAPKKLWRPLIVIVDEAHQFAPEVLPKGGSMTEREIIGGCKDSMVALATVGRKRGYGTVWATQRLAKVDKDASAELLNRLVGPTIEDVDVDRAVDLMSVSREEKPAFKKALKDLEPGNFFAFGRAISKERILVKVGSVQTTHPEPGSSKHADAPPPMPEKIRHLLPKLADLPKEAEQKAKTEEELRAEVRSLKTQLAAAQKARPAAPPPAAVKPPPPRVEKVPFVPKSELNRLDAAVRWASRAASECAKAAHDLRLGAEIVDGAVQATRRTITSPSRPVPAAPPPARRAPVRPAAPPPAAEGADGERPLLAGERRILEVLAQFHPGTRTRSQLGALTGLTPSGGTFGNYYGNLRRWGYLEELAKGGAVITEKGLAYFGGEVPQGPATPEELLDMWRGKLLKGERKMLDTLVERYPEWMTYEELGAATGFVHTGGTFGNYLGTLRRNEIAEVEGKRARAAPVLFGDEAREPARTRV